MDVEIRHILPGEYEKARQLWDACFPEDAAGYSQYYFAQRTRAEYVLAAFAQGQMLAALHAVPYPITVSGKRKPCIMLAGVATLPQYRRRGIAARLIKACHAEQAQLGTAAAILKPDADIYSKLGYIPFAIKAEYSLNWLDAGFAEPIHEPDAAELMRIYAQYSANYAGMLARTQADAANYIEEARVCGGKAFSTGKAYALLNENEYGVDIYELAGDEPQGLLNALAEEYGAITFRLPRAVQSGTAAFKTGESVFSMLCPLNEALLIADTPAASAAELAAGVAGCINTLEFC